MLKRRHFLQTTAAAGVGAAFSAQLRGANLPALAEAVPRYLESLARADGGYGFGDQEHSHLTPTLAVIGSYRALGLQPPRIGGLVEYVRGHHPAKLKKLEQERKLYDFQQIQALVWLGDPAADFRERVAAWTKPYLYSERYEQHRYPLFQSEMCAFTARALLGLPPAELEPAWLTYLEERRRENGAFNNTPARDGGDGHVVNTWWGLEALHLLGRASEKSEPLIAWLRRCQLPEGGFTYQPAPPFAGAGHVDYTWAALRALKLLGGPVEKRAECVHFLSSLANSDGGFGDRAGWLSNPIATWRALEALNDLDAPRELAALPKAIRREAVPSDLRVFTIQIEAHGQGSPAEAVTLAGALRIHLWGAKNAKPGWIARAQALADARKIPVQFFLANEEYDTWVQMPGLGTYSHTADVISAAGAPIGPSLAGAGPATWPEFRERRLAPLQQAGGRLIWQFGENEELVRLYLDDSVERGGYAAISTFHFGNPDFFNTEPFLARWRGQIPYIALQDAHGAEPWWFADMTTGFRTVFLAREPSWAAWLEALRQNWVVAIRRDAFTEPGTWMHSGSDEVLAYVKAHEEEWRWWDRPAIGRPLVSLVAVRPEDEFEAGRPESGVALRIRCAFENTTQGQPKKPLAELLSLTVDGRETKPELVTRHGGKGAELADQYHLWPLPGLAPGAHSATARIRVLASGIEQSQTLEFQV